MKSKAIEHEELRTAANVLTAPPLSSLYTSYICVFIIKIVIPTACVRACLCVCIYFPERLNLVGPDQLEQIITHIDGVL